MSASNEFEVTPGPISGGRTDLWQRIVESWTSVRASTDRLVGEKPSEARLLFYVLVSDLFFFASWSASTLFQSGAAAQGNVLQEMAFWLVIAMLVRTFFLYAFALGIGFFVRLASGTGDWTRTRIAVFWGALIAAPFGLAMGLLSTGLAVFSAQSGALSHPITPLLPCALGLVPFVWFITEAVAQVRGLNRGSATYLGVAALCSLGAAFGLFFKAQGAL